MESHVRGLSTTGGKDSFGVRFVKARGKKQKQSINH